MGKSYCIFAAQYLPHMGGVENYTSHLAKELLRNHNQVVIVTSRTNDLPSFEEQDGLTIYRVPCLNFVNGRFPVLTPQKEFFQIHNLLKHKTFDLIIVNTRFYLHSLYGVWYGKKTHTKTIVIDHGSSHLSMHNPLLDLAAGAFEHSITWLLKRFCKDYYGVSKASCHWLKHFHIKAKGCLYNAIDLNEIQALPSCESIRRKYSIPEDGILITFTGRLLKEKGLLPLTEAFKNLQKLYPEIYLFIAGDGELQETLQPFADSHYLMPGRLSSSEIIALLRESDIFCLPSVSEGFSTSILEAAACHTYVVVTKSACPFELIKDDSYGTILEDDSCRCIEDGLSYAITHPVERKAGAEKTYRRLSSAFTWKETADKIQSLT